MSASPFERGLDADEAAAALSAHGFGADRPASGAVVMAVDEPLRIVWANKAATTLFGTADAHKMFDRLFVGRGRDGLGESVARLAEGAPPRLERLRLIRGFRSQTVTVAVSRSSLPDGRSVVVLSGPAPDSDDGEEAPFAVSALRTTSGLVPEPDQAPPALPLDEVAAPEPTLEWVEPPAVVPDPELVERLAALRSARVLWQTDAEHRFVKVTDGIPEMLGLAGDDALLGRPLAEVLRPLAPDDERLVDALRSGASWSGLTVTWPLAAGHAAVVVALGAVPIMQSPLSFGGFRGFGVVDLTRLVVLPAGDTAAPAGPSLAERAATDVDAELAADRAAAREPLTVFRSTDPLTLRPGRRREAALSDAPSAPVAPSEQAVEPPASPVGPSPDRTAVEPAPIAAMVAPPSIPYSSKVVALRPGQPRQPQVEGAATLGPEGQRPEQGGGVDGEESSATPDLSSSERLNFSEIARALQNTPVGRQSEARAAEQRAAAAEDRRLSARDRLSDMATALDVLPLAVAVARADRIAYVNPAFLSLTGYASAEALRQAGDLTSLLGGLAPAHVAEAGDERGFPLIDAGGDVVPIRGRAHAILWDDAPATLLTVRPAEAGPVPPRAGGELHRQDRADDEAASLLAALPDAVAIVDPAGVVLALNPAAERLFGIPMRQAIGQPLGARLAPESQAVAAEAVTAALRSTAGAPVASSVVGRGVGSPVPLDMILGRFGAGRVCATFRPRAERNEPPRGPARPEADGKATNADLLAKISHEVRTPLNAILGFAEVILDERFGPIGNPRYKDYLTDIHDSGTHLLHLVTDLLDLSRMEAGRVDMTPTAIDANRVVGECVGDVQATAHRERVIVRLSLTPRLPAALVDERAFRQVVSNILSNAIKFNEPGGQVIVSTAVNEAGSVAVRIRDTGIGMSETEIATAMEPFRPIDTGKPGGGNGLGLPLTRALVEANRATMSIKSRKDEGTLVEIAFRASPAPALRVPAE